jgi:hypothetical protein
VPVLSSRPPRQTEKAAKCPEPLCPTRVLPLLGRREPSPERTLPQKQPRATIFREGEPSILDLAQIEQIAAEWGLV